MTLLYNSVTSPTSFTNLTIYGGGGLWGSSLEGDVSGALSSTLSSSPDGLCYIAPEYTIVRSPGNVALRSSLTRGYDTQRWFRAEVIGISDDVNRNIDIASRPLFWYAFSLYPFQVDTDDTIPETIFQFHNGGQGLPAAGGSASLPAASPGFGIEIDQGRIRMSGRCSPDQLAGVNTYYDFCTAPLLVPNCWHDFVIKHQIDWDNPGTGYVHVWLNGNLIFKQSIATAVNVLPDTYLGPYIKFGCYKRLWEDIETAPDTQNIRTRSYIHDEIRIGNSTETYETMRCSTPNPQPPKYNQKSISPDFVRFNK